MHALFGALCALVCEESTRALFSQRAHAPFRARVHGLLCKRGTVLSARRKFEHKRLGYLREQLARTRVARAAVYVEAAVVPRSRQRESIMARITRQPDGSVIGGQQPLCNEAHRHVLEPPKSIPFNRLLGKDSVIQLFAAGKFVAPALSFLDESPLDAQASGPIRSKLKCVAYLCTSQPSVAGVRLHQCDDWLVGQDGTQKLAHAVL
mmetsp:Transcript_61995/g.170334  ORF Transcript_61995/g.170334 Transcript_61995/m.170334 type:complete len:207 (-) Transcript_61995:407-1027(-)